MAKFNKFQITVSQANSKKVGMNIILHQMIISFSLTLMELKHALHDKIFESTYYDGRRIPDVIFLATSSETLQDYRFIGSIK